MEFGKRHDTTDTTDLFARASLLRTCYGEVANLLWTCCKLGSDTANKSRTSWQKVVVMEFGKRHDTTDTTVFCPRQLVTDLLRAGKLVQWMYTVGLKRMTVRGLTAGVVIMRCDHAAVVCLVS